MKNSPADSDAQAGLRNTDESRATQPKTLGCGAEEPNASTSMMLRLKTKRVITILIATGESTRDLKADGLLSAPKWGTIL